MDCSIGKNDGSIEGRRYFQCKRNFGLFVRQETIKIVSSRFDSKAKIFEFDETSRMWRIPASGTVEISAQNMVTFVRENDGACILRSNVDRVTNVKRSKGSGDLAWVFHCVDSKGIDKVYAIKFGQIDDADAFKQHLDRSAVSDPPPVPGSTDGFDKRIRRLTVSGTAKNASLGEKSATHSVPSKSRRLTVTVDSAPKDMLKEHADEKCDATHRMASSNPLREEAPAPSPLLPPGVTHVKSPNDMRKSVAELLRKKAKRSSWSVPVRVASRCVKGYSPDPTHKKYNQDAKVIEQDNVSGAWLFCVFDGHGENGHDVSSFFSTHIAEEVFGHEHWPSHPDVAMRECVLRLEKQLLRETTVDCSLSGTTAVMAATHLGRLTVANIGDSRIITVAGRPGDSNVRGLDISREHKPDLPEETKRIEKHGGRVFAIDYDDGLPSPARVWLKTKMMPGLAMSRSLGDTVAKSVGVISNPEIHRYDLNAAKDTRFLVLGSDGLFEFLTTDAVAKIVANAKDAESAASTLLKESKRLWLENEPVSDDTTIIIVSLSNID